MKRRCTLGLAATVLCGASNGVETRTAVPVFLEPKGDDGQFSDMLKVEMMKRKGLIKANVDIVRRPEVGRYGLEVSTAYRRERRQRTIWTAERATAVASAMACDAGGRLICRQCQERVGHLRRCGGRHRDGAEDGRLVLGGAGPQEGEPTLSCLPVSVCRG